MNKPKRHHFNPRLHLRNFAGNDPSGHVWTYDAKTGDMRASIPEKTAAERYFYALERPDGTMDMSIEERLADIEAEAGPTYKALLEGRIPSDPQKRIDFAHFLAVMYARTPTMRRLYAQGLSNLMQVENYAYADHPDAFDGLVQRIEAGEGKPMSDEYKELLRKTMLDPSGYVFTIPKERTLRALLVADELAPILRDMKWAVLKPERGFFITTDNPLRRDIDPRTRHPIYGDHGFLNKTAVVIFPLSPQRLLFLSWNERFKEGIGIAPKDKVHKINRALAETSDRYLYAHIKDKRLQRLAAEFRDSRLEMKPQGYGPDRYAPTEIMRRSKKG